MIDEQLLRQGLQKLLKETEVAVRDRLEDEPSLQSQLRERHAAAVLAERTEGSPKGYSAFADEAITQAAAHWLLGCVFVRFLEDNGWLDERTAKIAWIAGSGERLAVAKDRRSRFLRPDPGLTDRDYLIHVFAEVTKLPGIAGLFNRKHNPLYSLQPTAQGAARIVEFFQKVDPDSNILIHDFSDSAHRTRFLGDLYQNLSESARKRYALCQTPGFVVDFILDRTLTPALDAFGLETVRMIDPSCGSGHFLLAAFARLFRQWQSKEPGTNPTALVQRSLDAVYGVDLNPFAVEISRFRLLIAALESTQIGRLKDAPNFRFNLATGDSLLHGSRASGGGIAREIFGDRLQHFYETEDAEELRHILGQRYHVVVGNPPYINVSDSVLREAYRHRFSTCHGKYQLGVPFTERFFDLTLQNGVLGDAPTGWMGMIVSNAFMKRSFGKKLIEEYLWNRELTHVIDTSGVYLPGHGTPTAILLARNRPPVTQIIRAVRGIRGETRVPEDPANAAVWREIADNVDNPGFTGKQISVADAPRGSFSRHPWAIGGGGAAELKERMDRSGTPLGGRIASSGFASFPGQDDAFLLPAREKSSLFARPFAVGETCNDWHIYGTQPVLVPYNSSNDLIGFDAFPVRERFWAIRNNLKSVVSFGGRTVEDLGQPWWGWYRWIKDRYKSPLAIAFRHIASHTHFVLVRGGVVFNQHSPVIKLPEGRHESDYLNLIGVLNSSAACFWLKQVCFPKGGDTVGQDGARVRKLLWDVYYEFDSAKLEQLPIPAQSPLELAERIQQMADSRDRYLPHSIHWEKSYARDILNEAKLESASLLGRMIALQEEIDWQCYRFYGLLKEDLSLPPSEIPSLKLGQRAFEIFLARNGEEPEWFVRHGANPVLEIPSYWPDPYRSIVERRIAAIESNPDIALIERPEYKRRWNLPAWEEMQQESLKSWLLDRVEQNSIWKEHTLVSCARLRDALAHDADWLSVAETYHGRPIEALDIFVTDLTTTESVPYLPILRYTESGRRKRAEWEAVWALQRREDAGEKVEVPVPPKYISKDMQKSDYWRLRGGLDVPKERFILYPFFQRDSDGSPVLGWAGWSYLEQARALATYYQHVRTDEGWERERLKPILTGLMDLKPWLLQWHNELDPEMGEHLGDYFVRYAESQCQELGFSPEEVLAWQPPARGMARRGRKKTS